MNKKTILVTGSTDSIGKATALQLLNQGHNVIIHGRNQEKGRRIEDAVEMTLTVNSVAPFLLTYLLKEVLQKAAPGGGTRGDHSTSLLKCNSPLFCIPTVICNLSSGKMDPPIENFQSGMKES